MQETIFKLHLKKWKEALAILDTNTSNLHADELEAIGALKNLWRTVSFGSSCTQRVERMVKVLSDADKLHGNNRDIIQASKDFRGVAKEMYTTDAETLEQFRQAMQLTMGGPRRSPQQQQRRNERQRPQPTMQSSQRKPQRPQPQRPQPQRPQPQRPQPQRHAIPFPGRATPEVLHSTVRPQSRLSRWLDQAGSWFRRHGVSIATGAGLIALIAAGCYLLFQTCKLMEADETFLHRVVQALLRKADRLSMNSASIITKYFDVKNIGITFALRLEPWQHSRLDESYESFKKILLSI